MSQKLIFNNVDLSRYVDIRSISTRLAAPVTTNYRTFERVSGARFQSRTNGQIIIEVKVSMRSNTLKTIDELNRILHTDEEVPFYSEDRDDRYLMAMYVGESLMNRRYYGTTTTLTFMSSDWFWRSMSGEKEYIMDSSGLFKPTNNGTAPVVPKFEFRFKDESGFFAVVAPNGFIMLGNKEERDRQDLPVQELVIKNKMNKAEMEDNEDKKWENVGSNQYSVNLTPTDGPTQHVEGTWIPDYNKLNIGSGTPKWLSNGIGLQRSTNPKAGYYWNSWAKRRGANKNEHGNRSIPTSWKLNAKVRLFDASGTTNNTGMFLITVFDFMRFPIMTISMYNIDSNTNEVIVTAKINDQNGIGKASKIIDTVKFPNGFDGNVRMQTNDNGLLEWFYDSGRNQNTSYTVGVNENFQVGNTVYIQKKATHYYHYNGTRYKIPSFTKGRPNKITKKRTFGGKTQYEIAYTGIAIAWVNQEDLTHNKSGVGSTARKVTTSGKKEHKFQLHNTQIKNMKPFSIFIAGGTWDSSNAFTTSSISDVELWKLNGHNSWIEINNQFQPGDILTIDNASGEILQNGAPFTGQFEPDSRFFDLDYGDSEIQVVTSDWSQTPDGKMLFEERFR